MAALDTLSTRLATALAEANLSPAALAARIGKTEATVSNWLNDKVQADHVKAVVLLQISDALGVLPGWLLFGTGRRRTNSMVNEPAPAVSHAVKSETLTIALQLVAEALDDKGLTLPPSKRAELTALTYELLEEGMPEAKVLRFARAAAA
jgi:transcriptional regulator with XRE-family HTH domain